MESRTKSRYARYDSYYGTDRNAALAPVMVPAPRRRQQPTPAPKPRPKAQPKPKAGKWIAVIFLAAALSAMGCVVVQRNAVIYKNNIEISKLSKSVSYAQTMVNTAKMQLSNSDVNQYMQVAQDQLNMGYPKAEQFIVVENPAQNTDDNSNLTSETQERINIFDTILDWINSLERRI